MLTVEAASIAQLFTVHGLLVQMPILPKAVLQPTSLTLPTVLFAAMSVP